MIFYFNTISLAQNSPFVDSTFGVNGITITDIDSGIDKIYQLQLQPDGKIISVGYAEINGQFDFALARYNVNGTLDFSFDDDGIVTTSFGIDKDKAYSVVLQPDGKIIAAGSSWNGLNFDFAIAKYQSNGMLDSTFASNGKLIATPSPFTDVIYAIALQADGKIVVAGYSNTLMALMRFMNNGTVDSTFGINGVAKTEVEFNFNKGYALTIQPDGKTIAAGHANNGHDNECILTRYLVNGLPDSAFGTLGIVILNIDTGNDVINDIVLQPDGKIIAVGATYNPFNTDFVVARLNLNGSLDSSFSNDGLTVFSFSNDDDEAYSVLLQPDGKIIVAGSSINANNRQFAVARLLNNGLPDNTFGTAGLYVNFISANDYSYSAIQQPDNKIIVAGFSNNGNNTDFTLFRLMEFQDTIFESQTDTTNYINISPNPSANNFCFEIPTWETDFTQLILYNLSGEKIFTRYFSNEETGKVVSINISSTIISGLYLGVLSNGTKKKYFKLVIENHR